MFSKKKSLARIASIRSKREQTPTEVLAQAAAALASESVADARADEQQEVGNVAAGGEKEEEEEEGEAIDVLQALNATPPPSRHSKRMSWHWEDGALAVPLRKENSHSTPNLAPDAASLHLPLIDDRRRQVKEPRGFSRSQNHSLKYSGGALHSMRGPAEFDHDFTGENNRQVQMRRLMIKKQLGLEIMPRLSADGSGGSTSSTPESKMGSAPRRSQSVRAPPVVRVTEDGSPAEKNPRPRVRLRPKRASSPIPIQAKSPEGGGQHRSANGSNTPPPPSSRDGSPRQQQQPQHPGDAGSSYASSYNSDYDDDYDNHMVYCTPPQHERSNFLSPRKESVSKSKSMTSLAPMIADSASAGSGDVFNNSISANQARSRSFLVGSLGAHSLLGPQELDRCVTNRTIRVFVGTWNMNGNTPPRYLADFLLPQDLEYVPDVLVVGTQESFPERSEWEVRLQDTLGPSHVLFHSCSLGTLHQAVFLRRDLIWYCSIPETDSFNTRPGSQFRTKGAVATAFLLFGTSFLFVNSHLTAHAENTKDRIKDLRKINAMLNLPRVLPTRSAKHRDISDKFDCVFWGGDLNFRLEQSREVVIREVRDGLSVLDFDQLNFLRREGFVFRGYAESDITFPPTYKYDVGTVDKYDTSYKQRTPSFTDRILYKHGRSTEVSALYYDSVGGVTSSDHKPVWGMWEVRLRPGNDTIPLAGGHFNRQVYIEGMKRRAETRKPDLRGKHGANANMCNLQ